MLSLQAELLCTTLLISHLAFVNCAALFNVYQQKNIKGLVSRSEVVWEESKCRLLCLRDGKCRAVSATRHKTGCYIEKIECGIFTWAYQPFAQALVLLNAPTSTVYEKQFGLPKFRWLILPGITEVSRLTCGSAGVWAINKYGKLYYKMGSHTSVRTVTAMTSTGWKDMSALLAGAFAASVSAGHEVLWFVQKSGTTYNTFFVPELTNETVIENLKATNRVSVPGNMKHVTVSPISRSVWASNTELHEIGYAYSFHTGQNSFVAVEPIAMGSALCIGRAGVWIAYANVLVYKNGTYGDRPGEKGTNWKGAYSFESVTTEVRHIGIGHDSVYFTNSGGFLFKSTTIHAADPENTVFFNVDSGVNLIAIDTITGELLKVSNETTVWLRV